MASEGRPPLNLPTEYSVRAAVHVASLLDRPGSAVADARESYWQRATGGSFGPDDLRASERLLIQLGLVVERDDTLYPTPELRSLLDQTVEDLTAAFAMRALELGAARHGDALAALVPDLARREELLAALGRRFDDESRRLYGAIGEEIVVAAAREELTALGYPDLARSVRHVSLETDQAGYDVSAPRVAGPTRLLEVKATGLVARDGLVRIYLSRNEADAGARLVNWSLVVCSVTETDARAGEILGWCDLAQLAGRLPSNNRGGRWESASVEIAVEELAPGLPP